MKKIITITTLAALVLSFNSCMDMLNVHNPNYFTDEEMADYVAENPGAETQILSGLTASLYSYIGLSNAAINGGYSNSGMYESYKDFQRLCQAGEIVEGDQLNAGTFKTWYQNLASNTYWTTDKDVENYGYYYAAVLKIGPAQKALDFLTKENAAKSGTLTYSRAQALTLKALAYTQLMERYTDLDDVESTTKQGWPIYDAYAYNASKEPLNVKDTWTWINDTFAEADELFANSPLGDKGYTFGESDPNLLYDLDRAVCQYFRCRAAIDSKKWDVAIAVGEELLKHYPEFIAASNYGMPASVLADVNKRVGVSSTNPIGTGWNAEYPADNNAFVAKAVNPETIFGNGTSTSTTQYWSVLGLNCVKNGPSGYYQMDKGLYDSMSDSDCRKACVLPESFEGLNIFTHQGADTTWYSYTMPAYTSLKWGATCGLGQTNHDVDNNYANSCWLRSSAVVLMVAEAYAQSGNDAAAKNLLNKLLAARTLPGQTTMTCDNTMSGKSALDMVKLQWRLEMWGEGDWAFFNQKRWKETFTRGANHWCTTGIPAEGWTWQIPQKERQGNPYWN